MPGGNEGETVRRLWQPRLSVLPIQRWPACFRWLPDKTARISLRRGRAPRALGSRKQRHNLPPKDTLPLRGPSGVAHAALPEKSSHSKRLTLSGLPGVTSANLRAWRLCSSKRERDISGLPADWWGFLLGPYGHAVNRLALVLAASVRFACLPARAASSPCKLPLPLGQIR